MSEEGSLHGDGDYSEDYDDDDNDDDEKDHAER